MSILDQILAVKLEEIERLRPRGAELRGVATGQAPARPFAAALGAGNNVALIAEFKRRSPSAGWIRENALVAEMSQAYNDSGARAISVLTDERFFGGSLHDLQTARTKTSVPILRKDFIINELQQIGRASCRERVKSFSETQLRNKRICNQKTKTKQI